jgi:hypothetical protein
MHIWVLRRNLTYSPSSDGLLEAEKPNTPLPRWAEFLLAFDVKYRERRLHFLIEGQNRLYEMLDAEKFHGLDPKVVDSLKRSFYVKLDEVGGRQSMTVFSPATRALAKSVFSTTPSPTELRKLGEYAERYVDRQGEQIDLLVDQLAAQIGLNETTRDLDELLSKLDPKDWHDDARREVLVNYLGFPFWDILTFPLMANREVGEFNQILVDRISPTDAHALKGFDGTASLKGTGFGHFAAFLSRGYRENDYLLGRLHSLERLIDIVCDAAGVEPADKIDVLALKKRGFLSILATEEKHLKQSQALIAALKKCIAEMQ